MPEVELPLLCYTDRGLVGLELEQALPLVLYPSSRLGGRGRVQSEVAVASRVRNYPSVIGNQKKDFSFGFEPKSTF